MTIEINCKCDECKNDLVNEIAICSKCVEEAREESFEAGKKEGNDEGYNEGNDEGYNEGYASAKADNNPNN